MGIAQPSDPVTGQGNHRYHIVVTAIDAIIQGSKYKPGAEVYLSSSGSRTLTGPFIVASVASQGKYTLSDKDGNEANGGKVVGDKDLQKV